ncbi:hypothetical protein MKW94_015974 [Papaver nudicaule]|uniref:SKP1-like protein n=1 Tax=Papaver nudicaule TaxID=74823 RepID=A0AA41S8E8_PAPNU|nr:hypothetical protein [Papaver nudicaule]
MASSSKYVASSSSLTPKDVMKMKNMRIEEEEEEKDTVLVDATPESDGKKKKKQRRRRKGKKKATTQQKKRSVVLLSSSEGDVFEVDESGAMLSQLLKNLVEDDCAGNVIPLANISSDVMERVVVFLEKHGEIKERDYDERQELIEWDEEFIKDLEGDRKTLFDLVLAANYLSARCLLDVTCQAVADMIKGQTPEWMRKFFNIKNDFTPEEEAALSRDFGGFPLHLSIDFKELLNLSEILRKIML